MQQKIAFALIISIVTTGIISFTLISVNIGFQEKFIITWLRFWLMGYTVVTPAILFIGPKVQLFVNYLFKESSLEQSD
ncbi:DUF2798 domain-containing protein [Adhaeribacter pallidiroseus]|nr:DUF2798 domain-containing protein [Adhaeribacter pallidiroseus]